VTDSLDILENAPEYEPQPSPGLTLCDFSTTLCRATAYDPFLVAVAAWATLQLTWTIILAVSHLWQVSRQMTTFEVSNLGRYGFMGGRGGSSMRDQSGAMKQAIAIGAGIGPAGAAEEAVGAPGLVMSPDGTAVAKQANGHGPSHAQGHRHDHGHGHSHSHSPLGQAGRFCGAMGKAISGPLMQILGLDRFTKGKALGGMARAGQDHNPFDLGFVKVS
jgi:palmitoyltransferase